MLRFALFAIVCSTVPLTAFAKPGQVCVENGSDNTYLFTAEADDGARDVGELASGEQLCVSGVSEGTVAVFERADDLEGCSRRVEAGSTHRLTNFPSVDLCSWTKL